MKCPGQSLSFWKYDSIYNIQCPLCNNSVEFFQDDKNIKCNKCGHILTNSKTISKCSIYCKYSKKMH